MFLTIFDDGKGLEMNHKPGLGIISIQNRVSIINGKMNIQNRPGIGLGWTITIPLQNMDLGEIY
jgi:signal transduction histidine kinase